mmetsp:Transcript_345/g.1010  ORF Transcript_345/g.1010 Transcript_345/m.1010 type:complete len:299 (-) Transcript_345:192-1088(-)
MALLDRGILHRVSVIRQGHFAATAAATVVTILLASRAANSYPTHSETPFERNPIGAATKRDPTATATATASTPKMPPNDPVTHNFSGVSSKRTARHLPTMIVFDLDDCLWHPEMHELPGYPDIPVTGDLDPSSPGREIGIVGMQVPRRRDTVRLYEGARLALRELAVDPQYEGILLAAASSSLEPSYSHACLEGIEVVPGLTLRDMFAFDRIGRSGELTPRKTSHFRLLHRDSGVPYEEMLFFDDCNWGDHCADVSDSFGVISQRTPSGMRLSEFHRGLANYKKAAEDRAATQGGGEL